jgi:peptidoglycan/LPS O-acetylase OafA/YrhL
MSVPKERLAGLDALRFFAACLVMMAHLTLSTEGPRAGTLMTLSHYPAFSELGGFSAGWVGVQIFFVISGFVIAYSAEGTSPLGFVRSRVVRLAPALVVCSTVTFLVLVLGAGTPLRATLLDLARTWILWPLGPWVDAAYWTLVIEVIFYASILGLLLSGQYRLIGRFAIGLGLISAAYNIVSLFVVVPGWRPASLLLVRDGVYFALGTLIWLSFFKRASPIRLGTICICLVGGCFEITNMGRNMTGPTWVPILIWLTSVFVVALSVRFRNLLSPLPVRTIGLATYPLYLLHAVTGSFLVDAVRASGVNRWLALASGISIIFAASIFFVLVVEPPIKRVLKRLFDAPSVFSVPISRSIE